MRSNKGIADTKPHTLPQHGRHPDVEEGPHPSYKKSNETDRILKGSGYEGVRVYSSNGSMYHGHHSVAKGQYLEITDQIRDLMWRRAGINCHTELVTYAPLASVHAKEIQLARLKEVKALDKKGGTVLDFQKLGHKWMAEDSGTST